MDGQTLFENTPAQKCFVLYIKSKYYVHLGWMRNQTSVVTADAACSWFALGSSPAVVSRLARPPLALGVFVVMVPGDDRTAGGGAGERGANLPAAH